MLDKLANLPMNTRAAIRYSRVVGDPLMLYYDGDDVEESDGIYYRTAQVLKLLPGLQLKLLTILGGKDEEVSYHTLDQLVYHGNGFKELHFISHDSTFLGYKCRILGFGGDYERLYLRKLKPSIWEQAIKLRDGESSNPSVLIYRSRVGNAPQDVLNPNNHQPLIQEVGPGQYMETYGTVEGPALMSTGERNKQILVVAKCGTGINYKESENSVLLPNSIEDSRRNFGHTDWAKLKAAQAAMRARPDDEDEFFDSHHW